MRIHRLLSTAVAAGLAITAASGSASLRAQGEALEAPAFHHLHLNAVNPTATIEGYRKLWPTTTEKVTVAGFEGLKNIDIYMLWNKVAKPAPVLPQSAYWHQVWLTQDVRAYVKRARAAGMAVEPLYTSDEGGSVEVNTDTYPGSLTRSGLAEAKAKGVQPTRTQGYTYIAGPDGLSVEGFERANDTERLAQLDMWQDDPVCAELWYERHLGGTRRPPANGPAPTEANCKVATGEPTWPSTMKEGTKRTPSGRVTYGNVTMFWYTKPGAQPLASTLGQAVDHYAFSVKNLDAWVAKLRREKVKILREPYAFGSSRAVLVEGPSKEALELIQVGS